MCQSQQTPEADNHQTIRSREHIPALDGVRGIAILMVMSHHFTIIGSANPVEKAVSGVLQLGWAGVDLFFVLSGYLITGILLDSKRSPHYYRNFYARRVLRIFPLYYAVVLLTFLVLPRLDGSLAQILSNTEGSIGWYITYLSNFAMSRGNHFGYGMLNVTWSLAIEEQFYLVWPLFVCVMRPQTLLRLCLSLIVGAPLLRLSLVLQSASWVTVYTMPFCRIDALAFGALVALGMRDTIWRQSCRRAAGGVAVAAMAGLATTFVMDANLHPARSQWMLTLGFSSFAGLFAAAITSVVTATEHTPAVTLCSSRTLTFLGKYSYGLYLIHVPVRNVLVHLWPRLSFPVGLGIQCSFLIVAISISCMIAVVVWRLLERPFLKLKVHFCTENPRPVLSAREDSAVSTLTHGNEDALSSTGSA